MTENPLCRHVTISTTCLQSMSSSITSIVILKFFPFHFLNDKMTKRCSYRNRFGVWWTCSGNYSPFILPQTDEKLKTITYGRIDLRERHMQLSSAANSNRNSKKSPATRAVLASQDTALPATII